jgi:hypothetical protein
MIVDFTPEDITDDLTEQIFLMNKGIFPDDEEESEQNDMEALY